ncbi:MAG: hypothetical protein NZ853_10875 [Leptospiraceae bacterium]|nr:hypothetical protein [Leptospiraceae bacterium]MDW7977043.1 hypothetical protein [Leptospiraceae bacterium]
MSQKESSSQFEDIDFDLEALDLPDFTLDDELNIDLDESVNKLHDYDYEVKSDSDDVNANHELLLEQENQEEYEDFGSVALTSNELDEILELESIDQVSEKEIGSELDKDSHGDYSSELEISDTLEKKESVELPEPIEIDLEEMDESNLKPLKTSNETTEIDEVEQPISLSENELDDILSEVPEDFEIDDIQETNEDLPLLEVPEPEIPEEELVNKIVLEDEEKPIYENQGANNLDEKDFEMPKLSDVSIDDDESISLTPEELDQIVSGEEFQDLALELHEEVEQQENVQVDEIYKDDLETIEVPEPIVEDEEKIALTDNELTDIIEEIKGDLDQVVVPEPEIYEVKSTLDQGIQEKEIKDRSSLVDEIESETGIRKEELKKIIAYLDTLFDKLPDDVIKEFSRSEYFNLYKKVIETLGIYPPEN